MRLFWSLYVLDYDVTTNVTVCEFWRTNPLFLHTYVCLTVFQSRFDSSPPVSWQQGSDYRLCKSEPELTTVKEEVDEEKEKAEPPAESKDTAVSKGTTMYLKNSQLSHKLT